MANIIYKGALDGTQVNFETGNLTDISTFTGDVRAAAIEDSIANGVTDRGASQDAIHAMSGYLAANAHPSVTPATDIAIDNSNGTVLQDATFTFDDDGHVTAASFVSKNLNDVYFTEGEVTGISGALQSQITSNDGEILANATDIVTLSGLITGNDGDIATNAAAIATNTGNIATNAGGIATNAAAIATNTGNIATNVTNIATNAADIDTLSGLIDTVEAYDLDDVSQNGSFTSAEVEVKSLRVSGDGSSASITGPAIITIDPDAAGASGKVVIAGDLQVDGTTTTINSTSVQIDDLSLVLGTGAPDASSADGGGIIIDGTGAANIAEFTFDGANNRWKTNSLDIEADIVGNASTASKWSAATTLSLAGDLGGSVVFDGSDTTETLTATIGAGVVESGMLAGSIPNSKLLNSSVAITGGAGLAGGGDAVLGGSAVSLSVGAGNGLTANTDDLSVNVDGSTIEINSDSLRVKAGGIGTSQLANDSVTSAELDSSVAGENITFNGGELQVLDGDIRAAVFPSSSVLDGSKALVSDSNGKVSVASNVDATELSHLNGVSSNIQDQLDNKADDSTEMSAGNGLTGGGTLAANRTFATTSDQGHLNEIKLGEDSTTLTDIIVKGGILILRGLSTNGITTSGSNGDVLAIDQKTTVSYDGIVQIMNTNEDTDDGSWNGLWKVQGIIRRDSGSTISKVSCFTTKIHAGSNLSAYSISTTTSSTGFVISPYNAGNSIPNNIITTATLNYNWSQEA